MERNKQLAVTLHALNDQFFEWICQQHKKSRDRLWLSGVRDYLKYGQQLQEDFRDVLEAYSSPNGDEPARARTAEAQTAQPQNSGQVDPQITGVQSSKPAETQTANAQISNPSKQQNSTLEKSENDAPHASGNQNRQSGESNLENEADEGLQANPESQSQILFRGPASLHLQSPEQNKAWESRGKGLITLRRPASSATSTVPCHLVFSSETGKVLVNAALYAGLKPQTQSKGRILLSLPIVKHEDGGVQTEQRIVLLRLSEEEAHELVDLLLKHQPTK